MAGLCGITILVLTEQEGETEMMELLGLAVLLIAGKLIYSNSQNAFINRAVRKACVSKGTLLNTYEDDGRSYGTYEYEAARAVHGCGLRRGIDVGVVNNEISLERISGKIAVPWLSKAVAQRFCVGGGEEGRSCRLLE